MRVNVGAFICKSDLFNCIYLHSHISTARFDRERACLALRRTLRIRLVCCTRIHFSIHFAVEWPIKVPLESHMCSPSHYLCSQPTPLISPLSLLLSMSSFAGIAFLSCPVLSCPGSGRTSSEAKGHRSYQCCGMCKWQVPRPITSSIRPPPERCPKAIQSFFPSLFIFAVNKFETLC